MKLEGLHILLTYQCTYECDHCFVWGSPRQTGTLTLEQIEQILHQAKEAGVTSIYFEGGEPFLYYRDFGAGRPQGSRHGFLGGHCHQRLLGKLRRQMQRSGCARSRGGWQILR